MVVAIYPGTFDPPTMGHVDIARRSSRFFDKLYIGVGLNSSKQNPAFSQEERVELFRLIFADEPRIEVVTFQGLLVDVVTDKSIGIIIRSVRTSGDIDFEISQAALNRKMVGVETFWMSAASEYRDISSTLVQEIGKEGRSLKDLVPDEILDRVEQRLAT